MFQAVNPGHEAHAETPAILMPKRGGWVKISR